MKNLGVRVLSGTVLLAAGACRYMAAWASLVGSGGHCRCPGCARVLHCRSARRVPAVVSGWASACLSCLHYAHTLPAISLRAWLIGGPRRCSRGDGCHSGARPCTCKDGGCMGAFQRTGR